MQPEPKVNVLAVDDDPKSLLALKAMLEQMDVNVITAASGQEALTCALNDEFAVILMDVQMPGMDGFETARLIRQREKSRHTPLIFATAAYKEEFQIFQGYDLGAVNYLFKPIVPEILCSKVAVFIELYRKKEALNRQSQEHIRLEQKLKSLEWMLSGMEHDAPGSGGHKPQPYGDLIQLNTCRLVRDSVGEATLTTLVADYLDLLGSSAAVYERNGDYAMGIFSSGWCRRMDGASRKLCGTDDNAAALQSGRWHCHESCWKTSKASIDTGQASDFECLGGIRIHAVPIIAGGETVGSINFGYGDPPRDPAKQQELAERYGLSVDELQVMAQAYESRPPFIIDLAKKRLQSAARLIGEIIERKRAERELHKLKDELELRVQERTAELFQTNVALCKEIAEHRQAQEAIKMRTAELIEANSQLMQQNQENEMFVYSVSHDLRSPLVNLQGFSNELDAVRQELRDVLADDNLPAGIRERGLAIVEGEMAESLRFIQSGVLRLSHIMNALLRLSRLGRVEYQWELVDLNAVLSQVVEALNGTLHEHSAVVKLMELPPAWGDRFALEQIFANLIGNAVNYLDPGRPGVITVGTAKNAAPAGSNGQAFYRYFVKDNGVGIARAHWPMLFQPFKRLRPEMARGEGLGLAIVRRIVERHGGRIEFESEEGSGTTFFVTLPASPNDAPPPSLRSGNPVEPTCNGVNCNGL